MRILLFGANGQVGRETLDLKSDHEIIAARRDDADLAVPGAAGALIAETTPDAVLNAAAYTAVDAAEGEPEAARRINAEAVGEMAAAARKCGAQFLHISTDYVFDGTQAQPLDEDAETGPLNVYGKTKCEGERLALAAHPQAVILRTSWVYSVHGKNFVKTMLRLAAERDALSIVGDQVGGPTPASAIADAGLRILETNRSGANASGVYHFQGAPATSWAGFAKAIFAATGAKTDVSEIPTSDYPTPATRPLQTVLDCSRIFRDFAIAQPDWRAGLPALIAELTHTD